MSKHSAIAALVTVLALFPCPRASAATIATQTHKPHTKSSHKITETTTAQKKMARLKHSSKTAATRNSSSIRVVCQPDYQAARILRTLLCQLVLR